MRRLRIHLVCILLIEASCVALAPAAYSAEAATPATADQDKPTTLAETDAAAALDEAYAHKLVRKTLLGAGDLQVRLALIEQIEKKRQTKYINDLADVLSDDSTEIRDAALRAITSFDWEHMSPPMLALLRNETAPAAVRELVCRTLTRTGRKELVGPLIDLVDDPQLTQAVLAGLRELTAQELVSRESWREWWQANKGQTREAWAQAAVLGLRERIRELEKELAVSRKREAELEDRTADAIIRVLELRADKQDPAGLITALDEPFVKVRKYAAAELAKLKAREAVAKLSELAVKGDTSPELRVACASALGQIGSEEAVPLLAGLMGDVNEEVAAAAARALGRLKAPTAVNRLLLALLSPSPVVRASAAEALGQIGKPAAVVPLVELLASDPESSVRERAARALGEIGDKQAYPALEKALADPSPAVRIYAIEALGAMRNAEIAPRLCEVLEKDSNPSVREAAAVTLGKIGGGESLPVLIRVLDRPQEKLAQLASSSILAICRRDDKLLESTAERLVKAGHHAQAVTLYELLARKLAEGKDDKQLISVQVKLVESLLTLKDWTKAAPLLEELTRTLPDDIVMLEKYANTLTELNKHPEAFRVYRDLARRKGSPDTWDKCLALLDRVLDARQADEAQKLIDETLGGKDSLPEEVKRQLVTRRTRSGLIVEEERHKREAELQTLIQNLASEDAGTRTAALTRLKAMGPEAYGSLVAALDWADEKVRRAAVGLLRELTKQDFGYRPEASLEENAEAIRKWKAWLAKPKGN